MQFFKPENYFEVRKALEQAGRQDLIGNDCDSLIPDKPPREAIQSRRKDANNRFRGEYVHTIGGKGKKKSGAKSKQSRNAPGKGYRPKGPKSKPTKKKRRS